MMQPPPYVIVKTVCSEEGVVLVYSRMFLQVGQKKFSSEPGRFPPPPTIAVSPTLQTGLNIIFCHQGVSSCHF